MPQPYRRRSPDGRPIRVLPSTTREVPPWLARRRQAYKVIDLMAAQAKAAVKRCVPKPAPEAA